MVKNEGPPPLGSDRDSFINEIIAPTGVSAPVIAAFEEVDRAEFMYKGSRDMAYTDLIVDLYGEATISQPSFVACMIDLLELKGRERVLEIGTATGYQAALLSRLVDHVDTVEVDPSLVYWARSNLKRLRYPNVTVHHSDGAKGLETCAPFDAIIVTAGLRDIPQTLKDQLAIGGRIVAPVGELPEKSRLVVLTKTSESETKLEDVGRCGFVPLFSPESGGWTKEALKEAREARKREIEKAQIFQREQLKASIVKDGGEAGYQSVIDSIGGSVARIVGEKDLAEGQVLDLLIYFSDMFHPKQNPEQAASEEPVDAQETEHLN